MTHGLPVNLSGNLRLAVVGRPAKNGINPQSLPVAGKDNPIEGAKEGRFHKT
jgi:hypothetical protein